MGKNTSGQKYQWANNQWANVSGQIMSGQSSVGNRHTPINWSGCELFCWFKVERCAEDWYDDDIVGNVDEEIGCNLDRNYPFVAS